MMEPLSTIVAKNQYHFILEICLDNTLTLYMQKKREQLQRDLTIRIQPSLFKKFQKKCADEYKSISQAMRDLILQYVNKKDTND